MKYTPFDSFFRADPESVFSLCLKVFFKSESHQISSKIIVVSWKPDFLFKEMETKKKRYVTFCLIVWRVKRCNIIGFITYVEKGDRLTKSTSTWWNQCSLKRSDKHGFQTRIDLRRVLDWVYDAESGQSILKTKNIRENKKCCIFHGKMHFSLELTPPKYFAFFDRKEDFAKV
jgi:hypothetical protein